MLTIDCMASPIGPLTVAERDGRVCLLHFRSTPASVRPALARWYPDETIAEGACNGLRRTLDRYFDGKVEVLDGIDVELNGTDFQRAVWTALRSIRAGTTLSYSELAGQVGRRAAVRAVGAANGANPVALIVPCHRVIGSDGSLTGYGGGLERKQWLLAHEGVRSSLLF